jgi:hypothetical protein
MSKFKKGQLVRIKNLKELKSLGYKHDKNTGLVQGTGKLSNHGFNFKHQNKMFKIIEVDNVYNNQFPLNVRHFETNEIHIFAEHQVKLIDSKLAKVLYE